MKWIGLTGGIASGKSTVSRVLRWRGFPVVDADQLARDVVAVGSDGYRQVLQVFGPGIIGKNHELDRKKIGAVVFNDREKLDALEAILHPLIRDLAVKKRAELESQGFDIGFYDVPLLFEKKMESLFDSIVVVACQPEAQLLRMVTRDGLTEDAALARLNSQIPIGEKVQRASEVILNNGSLKDLEGAIDRYIERLQPPHQAQT